MDTKSHEQDPSTHLFLTIPSESRLEGDASDFFFEFPTRFHIREFQLSSTLIPKTQFHIGIGSDDFFFQIRTDSDNTWRTIRPALTVPSSDFENVTGPELAEKINAAFDTLGGVYVSGLICSYKPYLKKFYFQSTLDENFHIRLQGSTAVRRKVLDMMGWELDSSRVESLDDIISGKYVAGTVWELTSPRVTYFQQSPMYYISLPELTTNTYNYVFGSNTIVACIPNYFDNSTDLVYETESRTTYRYQLPQAIQVNNLSFRLLDRYGNTVDMKNREWVSRWVFGIDPHKDPYTSGDYFYDADQHE